ncbi:MAG: hypothetical protein ORN83_02115 [Chthoniobacteraceae bacterium]|nr:hypothetical protein [Chthoniobacteraceae bacterium]
MKTCLIQLILAAFALTGLQAQDGTPVDRRPPPSLLGALDGDKDGALSETEFNAHRVQAGEIALGGKKRILSPQKQQGLKQFSYKNELFK